MVETFLYLGKKVDVQIQEAQIIPLGKIQNIQHWSY